MIPQPPLRVTDSFPQGSLGPYGAAGGHIGPPLPVYRGAKRRAVEDAGPYGGTTGSAMRWADVPKAWLPPTKFRAEIWGVSHGHRPLRDEREALSTTLAAERLRQRSQGVGLGSGRDHPQRGHQPRAIPQSRLRRDSSLCTREPLGRGMRIAASLRSSQ